MSDTVHWGNLLKAFSVYIEHLDNSFQLDIYGISDTLRDEVTGRAQRVQDAMTRDGVVPSPGKESDDPRHKVYDLLQDLIMNPLPNDMWKPLPCRGSFYVEAFCEAIDAAESTLTGPSDDSGPLQTHPTTKGTPPESTAPTVHIEGVGQVLVDEKSQTITVNDHVIRFGGIETWNVFLRLWKNRPRPIDLKQLTGREPRDVAKDVRKVLKKNGAASLAKRLKSQRSVGYYFDTNDADRSV